MSPIDYAINDEDEPELETDFDDEYHPSPATQALGAAFVILFLGTALYGAGMLIARLFA